jgi:uncharacterized protein
MTGRDMGRSIAVAAMMMLAVPASAQMAIGGAGDQFLQKLKEGKQGEAVDLLKDNATVANYRGRDGDSALHIVTRQREGTWISYLINNGADANAGNKDGDSALIIAARIGYDDGVARLLAKKAKVDKENKRGETPLIVAVQQRRPALVRALLEAGANPDKRDFVAGYSARDYAKRDSRMPELLKLIESVKSAKPAAAGPTKP